MSSTVNKLLKDVGLDFGTEVPESPAPFQFKEENKEQRLEQEKRQKRLLTEARDKKPTIKPIEPNNNIQRLLRDVGVERVTKTSIQIEEDVKEDVLEKEQILSVKERHEFELKMLAEKATKMREAEEEEKRLNEESERLEISRSEQIQNKLANPFTLGKKVDSTTWREAAINELSKTYIPEAITSYPEPFEEEPALNRELSEFKKKINEHMRKMGFASSGGGGAGIVGDLDDVDISNRGHKTILMYNDVTKKYEFADPDLDAGISNEDDSGDEIILNATTSGGADEGGSIQQENNTRMAAGATTNTTVSSLSISTPTLTLTDSEDDTVTVDLSGLIPDVAASVSANGVTGTMIALGSDAAGDIMYYNGTDYVRLARGSDDEILTLASGAPSWAAASGGVSLSGSTNNTVATVTGSNALAGEGNLTFDGSTLAVTGAITGTTDLTLGDDLILDSDAAVIQFGDDQEIKLTHNHNQGLEITSTHDAPLVRRGEDVFIVLNGTDASSTDAGDNIVQDTSANDGDDIIGEDEVFLHTGMQREVINIVGSDGKIKKSIAGFSAGAI